MSNLPDGVDYARIDRIIASAPDREQVWEAHAAQLNDTINRAFEEWPLETEQHAEHRRAMLEAVLTRAEKAMEAYTLLSVKDAASLLLARAKLLDGNVMHVLSDVQGGAGDMMFIYRKSMEKNHD